VLSLFDALPEEGELVVGVEPPGLAAVPCGVPPGGAFLMTLNASGVSLSGTGPPGGVVFSMTLKAGGRGPSEAMVPPGGAAFSCTVKASGVGDDAAPEPGGWVAAPARAGWGKALGGRRITDADGGMDVEDLLLKVAEGRLALPGGVATLGGRAPGLAC
jgi:hypothetical protein